MRKMITENDKKATLVIVLENILGILENCDISSGVCMCGDSMEHHGNPMDCGHSPVDQGQYYAGSAIEIAKQALHDYQKGTENDCWTQRTWHTVRALLEPSEAVVNKEKVCTCCNNGDNNSCKDCDDPCYGCRHCPVCT